MKIHINYFKKQKALISHFVQKTIPSDLNIFYNSLDLNNKNLSFKESSIDNK